MSKTISQQFDTILKVIIVFCMLCGANTVDPKYRINAMTRFIILIIFLYFCFTIYTICVGYIIGDDDWTVLLQIFCLVGSGMQSCCKLINIITMKHSIRFLVGDLISIYKEYEKKNERYQNSLRQSINLSKKVIIFIAVVYFISVTATILISVYFKLILNRKEFIMQFVVPYVDPNTESGYMILNSIHATYVTLGGFGNFAADMYFFIGITHIILFKDILRCKFHDLNYEIRRCELEQEGKIKKTMERTSDGNSLFLLKDIFRWHQRFVKFINAVKHVYYWVIFVEIGTLAMGIACTMFCILLGKWPAGYIYLLYCFIILYVYCGLGTVVDVSIDGFTDAIYNDVIWYKLSIAEQKLLQNMLTMSQNTNGLVIGSVAPLSMNTGLGVTKVMYSFTMMLINFIE